MIMETKIEINMDKIYDKWKSEKKLKKCKTAIRA